MRDLASRTRCVAGFTFDVMRSTSTGPAKTPLVTLAPNPAKATILAHEDLDSRQSLSQGGGADYTLNLPIGCLRRISQIGG